MVSDIVSSGAITALDQTVMIFTDSIGSVGIEISGTWTGQISPEISIDGSNWTSISIFVMSVGTPTTLINGNGVWQANTVGCLYFRLHATAGITGSAQVVLHGSPVSAVINTALPNFSVSQPPFVIPIGAYNATNDNMQNLQVSDNSNGLLVEQQGPIQISAGSVLAVQYQSYSNGGSTALKANATLPALGAFTTVPTQGSDGTVQVPQDARRIIVYITYNRGAAGGKAAHKFYGYNGFEQGQLMAPDFTYNAINGAPSTGAFPVVYLMTFDVSGLLYFGIISAETGVTATPGQVSATITFA